VFRGLTIAGMILVNFPGNDHAYALRRHAPGHGWTFAWMSPPNASLAYSLCHILFCLGVIWLLHRRKLFIKV